MAKTYQLDGHLRTDLGRKVKHLRTQGQLPATVYGKKIKSVSLTVSGEAFADVYGQAGETGLVELMVSGTKRPVLIHTVQRHPVSRHILHIEFYQVDLKEKVHASVPLELVGESPAVVDKVGTLLSPLDHVDVEALPTEIPANIEVDLSGLAEVNAELKVKDLKIPSTVTVLSDPELTVVKIGSLVSREAEEQAAAEAAASAAQAAEGAEGAASAEGSGEPKEAAEGGEKPATEEAPKEEKKEEAKKE